MLQHGHFIFFFNCQLHLAHLESFLELMALALQVLPSLLLLSASLITLVQVSSQVLYLLLLLPENLPKFVCCVAHVLEHVGEFIHRF